ncbi:hypothetical protein MATL_G00182840 [Megalops atlanticus]|uniref:Uncharacterized protein n=1 Tax=Megalops atlanticus TaxID=7932 RepID=A0A9D3T051_MEGAT|nr:hypothetical protein MATL_G00182840 [Megalops atlanticus]
MNRSAFPRHSCCCAPRRCGRAAEGKGVRGGPPVLECVRARVPDLVCSLWRAGILADTRDGATDTRNAQTRDGRSLREVRRREQRGGTYGTVEVDGRRTYETATEGEIKIWI